MWTFAMRALMALVFVWSGTDKLRHPRPLAGVLQARGFAIAPALVVLCGLCEIAGAGLLLLAPTFFGASIALGVFIVAANLMVNNFWSLTGADAAHARQKSIAGAGMALGLFYMAASQLGG